MQEIQSEQVEAVLERFSPERSNLIPLLQEVQAAYRYLPQDVLRRIARRLRVPVTQVYQVATFYRCFSLVPQGKYVVQVCLGTACHVRGGPRVLERILQHLRLAQPGTTDDLQFTVQEVRCVGCCGLAPVVRVNNATHPHLTQAKVKGMLKKYEGKEPKAEGTAGVEAEHAQI